MVCFNDCLDLWISRCLNCCVLVWCYLWFAGDCLFSLCLGLMDMLITWFAYIGIGVNCFCITRVWYFCLYYSRLFGLIDSVLVGCIAYVVFICLFTGLSYCFLICLFCIGFG